MMVNNIKNCVICCDWVVQLFSLLRHPNILTLILSFYAEEVIVEHLTGSYRSFQSETGPFFHAFFCWLSLKLSPVLLHSYPVYCSTTRHKTYCKLVFRINAGGEQLEHLHCRAGYCDMELLAKHKFDMWFLECTSFRKVSQRKSQCLEAVAFCAAVCSVKE